MREGQKVMDLNVSEACIQSPGTTYLYPANTRRWATGQGYERVWSGGGEKGEAYFQVPAQTYLGINVLLG